ncbi:Ubiquitin-specific protease [Forsythia ovata]|uniref:Pre-mRNA-splicing factor SLU7 n=1 Tax=Forsythia ovata TaxID=205694 RepID=A0ABD1QAA6_9LAMI
MGTAQRVKIAVGAAKGFEYLHEKADAHIIHRDSISLHFQVKQIFFCSCGTMTHNAKTCMERPCKLGAKWTGKSIGSDQKIETFELDYNGKRDRRNGYDAALYKHVIKRYAATDGVCDDEDNENALKVDKAKVEESNQMDFAKVAKGDRSSCKRFLEKIGHEYSGGDMLEPRETDIPVLLLVLVVLLLVTYFLLGKWGEAANNEERISLIAQRAVEEALVVEGMAAAGVIPLVPLPNIGSNQCARCSGPAKTLCSLSGWCQIIHWRQVHKLECQQLGNSCSGSSPKSAINEEFADKALLDETIDSKLFEYRQQPTPENTSSDNVINHRASCYLNAIYMLGGLGWRELSG